MQDIVAFKLVQTNKGWCYTSDRDAGVRYLVNNGHDNHHTAVNKSLIIHWSFPHDNSLQFCCCTHTHTHTQNFLLVFSAITVTDHWPNCEHEMILYTCACLLSIIPIMIWLLHFSFHACFYFQHQKLGNALTLFFSSYCYYYVKNNIPPSSSIFQSLLVHPSLCKKYSTLLQYIPVSIGTSNVM